MRPKTSILSTPAGNIENSNAVRERVITSRWIQMKRAGKPNALLNNGELKKFCHVEGDTLQLLEQAAEQLYLSPRACHRILKVSRTIADLDQNKNIISEHVAEAIAFRRMNTGQNYIHGAELHLMRTQPELCSQHIESQAIVLCDMKIHVLSYNLSRKDSFNK